MGYRKYNVSSVTLRYTFCEQYVTFIKDSFTKESYILVNAFIKGILLSNFGADLIIALTFTRKSSVMSVK